PTTAAGSGACSFSVTLADNSSITFHARALDASSNASACSAGLTYAEDSASPAAPLLLGSTPASPANQNAPSIAGTAEAGATVRLYRDSGCASAVAGSGTAVGGAFSIPV